MASSYHHKVTFVDGSDVDVEWKFSPIAMIHAERQLGKPIGPMLADGFSEPFMFGIWFELSRSGGTPLDYEQWLGLVEDVNVLDGPRPKVAPDPKPSAAPKSSS